MIYTIRCLNNRRYYFVTIELKQLLDKISRARDMSTQRLMKLL